MELLTLFAVLAATPIFTYDAVVKVDGDVVLDLTGKSTWAAHVGRNVVGFGSLSSAATGEAWWDYVTWSGDLGYPITQRLDDGTLATIYYFNGIDNVTHICLTRWTPPVR